MGILDVLSSGAKGLAHIAGETAGSLIGQVAGKEVAKIASDLVETACSSAMGVGKGNVLTNALSTLRNGFAKLAEEAVGALLPEKLKSLKDLVGIAVNLTSGNYPAVIKEGLEFLQNLPELSKELSKLSANLTPSPPPPPPPAAYVKRPDPSSGSAPSGVPAASGTGTQPTSQTSASSNTSAPSSGSTEQTKESSGKNAAQKFLSEHSNPEDFMKQIRSGNIPEEVLNSQAGMMMVQERLHSIQQMNQLMTQMLKSMHDMSMAIVQNVRA
jgi:hypothetical protein